MDLALSVSNLTITLGNSIIIRDLSFDLGTGDTLVILGPNGAGKTVLLRALLGLLPYQGEVRWKAGIKIGYVPQRVPFAKDIPITVEDFFLLRGIELRSAQELLIQVGIAENSFLKKQLGYLSSGQFQRVLIAWALAHNPGAVLFDEPTAGVDAGGEETIHDLLRKVHRTRKVAVILVTHDLTTVYSEATHVLCLNAQKFCYGLPQRVLDPAVLKSIYGRDVKIFGHGHD